MKIISYPKYIRRIDFLPQKGKAFVSAEATLAGHWHIKITASNGVNSAYATVYDDNRIGVDHPEWCPKYVIPCIYAANRFINTLYGEEK